MSEPVLPVASTPNFKTEEVCYLHQLLAYSFRPVKSIPTTGSFPTTQALCPGGITAASQAQILLRHHHP